MKRSDLVIKRLHAMGLIKDPSQCLVYHHRGNGQGSFSWVISSGTLDIGSTESMKECLSWSRWIYNAQLHEIFPYFDGQQVRYGEILEPLTQRTFSKKNKL